MESVYFGGGTPSLMDPELVEAVVNRVQRTWRYSNNIEITLEANPSSVETARLTGYRDAGVNRVSIGVQALDDSDLLRLGRMHTVKDAFRAIDIGNLVFDRVNFDLIYARQDQSLLHWKNELTKALSLGSTHLSLYQLTVEDGTVFHQRRLRGLLTGLPSEELSADMYEMTQDMCGTHGLPSYEVSNHARVGDESRHNLIYWRGGEYAGIGPGAHGRLASVAGRVATESIRLPNAWLVSVEKNGSGEELRTALTFEEAGAEYLMMGLRLKDGVSISHYIALSGRQLNEQALSNLSQLGLIFVHSDRLGVTDKGVLLLNAILREILTL